MSLTLVAVLVCVALAFWAYRGSQVVRHQLREFAPNDYRESESGRRLLARAAEFTTQVEWTLADGTRQVAYYLPPDGGPLIVYAHGSPGRGLGMLDGEALLLAGHGYGALLVDLPGYGMSEGNATWASTYVESLRMAVDFAAAQPEVDSEKIGGFGYSNGGCLIARAAAEDERIRAFVLLAAYTNLSDQLHYAYRRRTPGMGYFAIAASIWSGVPVQDLDTVAALRRMTPRPVLTISGGRDSQIPLSMGEQLKSSIPNAERILYREIGHVNFAEQGGPSYVGSLVEFFDRAFAHDSERRAR